MRPPLEGYGQRFVYNHIERPLIPVLIEMEGHGILIDREALTQLGEELRDGQQRLRETALSGVDVGKGGTTGATKRHLYHTLGLPVLRRTDGGEPSTDDKTLTELAAKASGDAATFVAGLRGLRELSKLESTYVGGMEKFIRPSGRVRYQLHQVGTETGRMSCSSFNLQNIPATGTFGPRFRQCFIPEPGMALMAADYSQIEYRVVAVLANEVGLLKGWRDDPAMDAHLLTTLLLGLPPERRRDGKTLNFGLLYGLEDKALSIALGCTVKEAKHLRQLYWERLPGIAQWVSETKVRAIHEGYVETYFGRRNYIQIPENAERWMVEKKLREAVNMPVQGSAGDIEKIFMPRALEVAHDYNARMLLMVHDELVFEVPLGSEEAMAQELRDVGEHCVDIGVPIKLDVHWGRNWKEAKGE